jgi:hypothetical protein
MGTDQGQGVPGGGAAGFGLTGLQFDRIDAPAGASRVCLGCGRGIADEYFEIGGRVACRACSTVLTGGGTKRLVRALLFGGGAALVSMIVWYAIIKFANMELGLIAIGVGLFIGMAVRRGAGGLGGWKYQALAMMLTYGAVTVCKVPLVYQAIVASADTKKTDGDKAGDGDEAKASADNASAPKKPGLGTFLYGTTVLIGLALAMPFFDIGNNIMGLIIIGIALYEAWKLNKQTAIEGPFRLAPAVGAPPAAPPPATL